jgi:hypothetical protein
MKAHALWVTPQTYPKYVEAVERCEGHTVYPLFQVVNTYLVLRDYSDDDLDMRDCTSYDYNVFHSNYWNLDAHSYVDFFEVEHV